MIPIDTDEHGYALGFEHHDGFLDGVTLGQGAIRLALRTSAGHPYEVLLRNASALSVDRFREGNIVNSIRVISLGVASGDSEARKLAKERLDVDLTVAPEGRMFLLDSSYGAEIVALCTDALVSEP